MSTVKESAPSSNLRDTRRILARSTAKPSSSMEGWCTSWPTGYLPNRIAFRIARSLDDYAETTGYAGGRCRTGRARLAYTC